MFDLIGSLYEHQIYGPLAYIALIALVATIANYLTNRILLRLFNSLISYTKYGQDEDLQKHRIAQRLANTIPAVAVSMAAKAAPGIPTSIATIILNVSQAIVILMLAMALSSAVGLFDTLYHRRPTSKGKTIKNYTQTIKVVIYVIAVVMIIATLVNRSPLILLSGLGAMAAVLILVFQDTLQAIVAGIQLTSNDAIRVGDWIEMPSMNANGEIVEIALHNVKVQNWNRTFTYVPIRKLVTDSYINWRGMREGGARRIMRSIHLDQTSLRNLTVDEISELASLDLLKHDLTTRLDRLSSAEADKQVGLPLSPWPISNLGLLRAYIEAWLKAHPGIRQDMRILARHRDPNALGLPLEIYCFTKTVDGAEHEQIQAEIFEHVLTALPLFGLQVYQSAHAGPQKPALDTPM